MSQIYKSPNGGGGIVDSVTGGPGILVSPTTGNVVVSLANYTAQSTTTTNATPNTSMGISLGSTPGVYTMDINVSAYDSTNNKGAGFSIFGAVRTTGSAAVLLGFDDTIQYSDAADS